MEASASATPTPTPAHERLKWYREEGIFKPYLVRKPLGYSLLPGSQMVFCASKVIETLYEGTRGPGKTNSLIWDFCQHVDKGYGADWTGVLFRRTHPELADVIAKSKAVVWSRFPQAQFNEAKSKWEWPTGETLHFRHFAKADDYYHYHGWSLPWIGWEELTTWPDPSCYRSMFSCSRSVRPGMPRKVRSTTNPYGVGHNWVKARWRLGSLPPGVLLGPLISDSLDEGGKPEPPRIAVRGHLDENFLLLRAEPDYKQKIRAAARNKSELAAWLDGSWDVTAGGMFDDIWHEVKRAAVVPRFRVPDGWRVDRSFDWGSAKPFSVGWWAESDGTDLELPDGRVRSTVRGDVFRVGEWYGWSGQPNEGSKMLAVDIAKGIVEREVAYGWRSHDGMVRRVHSGPADSSIFDEENGNNIAADFERPVRLDDGTLHPGVRWLKADKGPGSREQGWQVMRKMMQATVPREGKPREEPGLFVVEDCGHWLRCVPSLPRDDKKVDDVDTEAEDHTGDETRYRLRKKKGPPKKGRQETAR